MQDANSTISGAGQGSTNLQMSFINLQMALDEANREINQLRQENAKLKAAALPNQGPKKNKRMVVTTPIDYSQDLLVVANKFTLLDFIWVKMSAFQSPCPPGPIPIETRYSDDMHTLLHIRYRLYECVPEKYHGYLQELAEFATNFCKSAQQQRSNIISKLHSAVPAIFTDTYPEIIPHLLCAPKDRGVSEICRRLYMSGNSPGHQAFESLLAPIIYAGGNVDANGIFQNEVLFLIGICSLFGYTAIKSKIPKNSQGFKWGIASVTSGFISFCCIAAVFLVSNDAIFEEVGSKSGINYGSAFISYKKRLEKYENTPLFQKIIKKWNTRLFGNAAVGDADSAEEFNFGESVNARSAAIDAALSGSQLDEPELPQLESGVISGLNSLTFDTRDLSPSVTSRGGSQVAGPSGPFSSVSGVRPEVVPPLTAQASSSHATRTLASRSNSLVFTVPASNPGSVFSLDQNDYSSDSDSGPQDIINIPHDPGPSGATQLPIEVPPVIQPRPRTTNTPSFVPAPPTILTHSETPITPAESTPIPVIPAPDHQEVNDDTPARVVKHGRPKKVAPEGGAAGTRRSTRNPKRK